MKSKRQINGNDKWRRIERCAQSPIYDQLSKTFISVKLKLTRQIVFNPAVQKTRKHRCNTPYVCCRFLGYPDLKSVLSIWGNHVFYMCAVVFCMKYKYSHILQTFSIISLSTSASCRLEELSLKSSTGGVVLCENGKRWMLLSGLLD